MHRRMQGCTQEGGLTAADTCGQWPHGATQEGEVTQHKKTPAGVDVGGAPSAHQVSNAAVSPRQATPLPSPSSELHRGSQTGGHFQDKAPTASFVCAPLDVLAEACVALFPESQIKDGDDLRRFCMGYACSDCGKMPPLRLVLDLLPNCDRPTHKCVRFSQWSKGGHPGAQSHHEQPCPTVTDVQCLLVCAEAVLSYKRQNCRFIWQPPEHDLPDGPEQVQWDEVVQPVCDLTVALHVFAWAVGVAVHVCLHRKDQPALQVRYGRHDSGMRCEISMVERSTMLFELQVGSIDGVMRVLPQLIDEPGSPSRQSVQAAKGAETQLGRRSTTRSLKAAAVMDLTASPQRPRKARCVGVQSADRSVASGNPAAAKT